MKNKKNNPANREPNLVTELDGAGVDGGRARAGVGVSAEENERWRCSEHTGGATAKSVRSERWPSHRERQLRRRGGWRQHPRGQADSKLGEADLGLLAG